MNILKELRGPHKMPSRAACLRHLA